MGQGRWKGGKVSQLNSREWVAAFQPLGSTKALSDLFGLS